MLTLNNLLIKNKEDFNKKGEIYLRIKVSPSSPATIVKQVLDDETIKIDIVAHPEKGKANQELIKFLAKEFVVSKNNIKIISGAGEKLKLIKIKA